MQPNLLITNEDIINLTKHYAFPDEDKIQTLRVLSLFGYNDGSVVDGLVNLLSESAGIYLDDSGFYNDNCVLYYITVNTFSNYSDICPYYWESENLDIFGDDVLSIIEEHTVDEGQYDNVLFAIRNMVFEVMKMVIFPMKLNTSSSLDVTFKMLHFPGSHVILTIPELMDYENDRPDLVTPLAI